MIVYARKNRKDEEKQGKGKWANERGKEREEKNIQIVFMAMILLIFMVIFISINLIIYLSSH